MKPDKPAQCLLQVLSIIEVVRSQYLTEPSVETLDHTVGLRRLDLWEVSVMHQRLLVMNF